MRLIAVIGLAVKASPFRLTCYVMLTVATGTLPVVAAWLTKLTVDGLIAKQDAATLIRYALGLGLVGLIAALAPQLIQYLQAGMGRRVSLIAQDRLLGAVNAFPGLVRFETPAFADHLRLAQQSASTSPSQAIDNLLTLVQAAITIIGFLGSLLVINPWITCVVMLSGVPMLVSELLLSRRRAAIMWKVSPMERRELFYEQLLTSIEAAKEVRLFGLGQYFRERFLVERRKADSERAKLDLRELLSQTALGFMGAVLSAAVLFWGILATRAGTVSVGDLMIFITAIAGVQGGLLGSANAIAQTHQALMMFEHYRTVLETEPDLPAAAPARTMRPLAREIEFRDVWFRYSPDHPWVLSGVNLRIAKGETLALVGLNGAGKSTLISLLCRFYDPTRGSIRWDGVDIRDFDTADLRRRIGAVYQDFMTYDLTATENIGLGDLTKLQDRTLISAAAERADVHEKITTLPRGFETMLSRVFYPAQDDGDDPQVGVPLSGGQWQKLALARAFLRDERDVMILDEPASGLDAEAEDRIHRAIKEQRSGRTNLLISHRLGAVRSADTIVVLSGGSVVEHGDHETLLSRQGEYARLFELQASGYTAARPTGSRL